MQIVCKDINGNELTQKQVEEIVINNKICNEIIANTKTKINATNEQ